MERVPAAADRDAVVVVVFLPTCNIGISFSP